MYDITQLISDLTPKLHGLSLDKISGSIYDKLYEASRKILTKIDPKETIRITSIENALYDNVYTYICPSDLKDNKIINIRPQSLDTQVSNFIQRNIKEFDINKDKETFTIEYDDTIKTIKLSKANGSNKIIETFESLDGFTATGQLGSLSLDTFDYITGQSALKFNLSSGGTSGYYEKNIDTFDITDFINSGSLFLFVKFPTTFSTTDITNIQIRIGNNSSNYYTVNATHPHDSTTFKVGWNLLRFDLINKTTTGTVDDTSIDYLRTTFTFSGTQTISSIEVDSMSLSVGSIYEIMYYSDCLFRNSDGLWIQKPTSENDVINLGHTSYNLLLWETAYIIAHELQAQESSFDLSFWDNSLKLAYKEYASTNKSQATRPQNTYYRKLR